MVYLPPPFLVFCLQKQHTPFDLHEFVAKYATQDNSGITVGICTLLMDWCVVATQTTKSSTPTTSILAISLQTAPPNNDNFLRWLYKIDRTRTDEVIVQSQPAGPSRSLPIAGPPPSAGPPPPSADVWEKMAQSISTSFTSAEAAIKPPTSDDPDTAYEFGGKLYDKFQMAAVKGFAHVHDP